MPGRRVSRKRRDAALRADWRNGSLPSPSFALGRTPGAPISFGRQTGVAGATPNPAATCSTLVMVKRRTESKVSSSPRSRSIRSPMSCLLAPSAERASERATSFYLLPRRVVPAWKRIEPVEEWDQTDRIERIVRSDLQRSLSNRFTCNFCHIFFRFI